MCQLWRRADLQTYALSINLLVNAHPHKGKQKLQQIKENSNYFRRALVEMGCQVLGDNDSPVIPLMIFSPSKISLFSRECFKRGVSVSSVSG